MKESKNRRQFIKEGVFGLAGIMSAPAILGAGNSKKEGKMIYRTLGKTGIKLPIISIGAASYDVNLYKTALDSGIKHIDTSQYYYNGRHEKLVGEVIKGRPRDSVVIATSILLGKETTGTTMSIKDAAQLPTKFNVSLERMGIDYVDIFYVASVGNRETVLNEELLNGLEKLKKSGKVRFTGVATHRGEPEVIDTVVEHKSHDVVLAAYNFRQSHNPETKKAIAAAAKAGIGIVAMKTQAGAYWDSDRKNPINGTAALKWAVSDPNVHTAIPGIKTLEQLETNLSIMENLVLTPQEKTDLKLGETLSLSGLYCSQCGQCVPQCPKHLEIPVLMRGYMYAYGYRDLSRAMETLRETDLTRVACTGCTGCSVNCTMGFNVREKVLDIARLKDVPGEFLA